MVIRKPIISIPMRPLRRSSKQAGVSGDRSDIADDILLTLRRVSQTLGARKVKHLYVKNSISQTTYWKTICLLCLALVTLGLGIGTLIHSPLQMLLDSRLEMTAGMPPFEWWADPPDTPPVLLKAYIFNITNAESFQNGTHKKLIVKEVGPIIYREILTHTNIKHNENSTLTYTTTKRLEFLPEMNTVNPNDTVIVPNMAILLIPALFQDSSMLVKLGVNMILRSFKAQPIINTTIYNYLWNTSDPILIPARNIAPSLVPTTNTGILSIVYSSSESNLTVLIGKKHGNSEYFKIDKFEGSEYLPHFSDPNKCQQKFRNSSEGMCYPQMLSKNTNLTFWNKALCKLADLRYASDDSKYGMYAYRYNFVSWAYDRVEWEGNEDCYAGSPSLPNGLADISTCYWGFPIAVSFPHFLHGDDIIRTYVDGMTPNQDDHGSYVLIEPTTGVPLEGVARSQINLVMKKFHGFPDNLQRFSNTVLPLAWIEFHQIGLVWYLQWCVYFMATILPITHIPFSIICIALGLVGLYFTSINLRQRTDDSMESLIDTSMLGDEGEAFLNENFIS